MRIISGLFFIILLSGCNFPLKEKGRKFMSDTQQKYEESSQRGLQWLDNQLQKDGSYGPSVTDLASYYKSPYLFYLSGRAGEANRILNHVKKTFMRKNGDFTTQGDNKSANGAFVEYWAYTNGWIAMAAQKMGRFDVAYPAWQYLKTFYHLSLGGFTTNKPYGQGNNNVDVLTTAHLGLVALYFGDMEKAKSSGELLKKFINIQPDKSSNFYLRMTNEGNLITDFPKEMGIFFTVSAKEPNQAYFMIGYPIAFLGKLYRATGDSSYLEAGKDYLKFAQSCHDNIRSFHFSHKVAWGSAIIARLTKNPSYVDFSKAIANYLLGIQDKSGAWLKNEPAHTSFDQTAEIAIWLKEITTELMTHDS